MTDKAAAYLGRKGGKNSRKNLEPSEATRLARKAVAARWDKYYREHPDKRKKKAKKAKA
jgi:hypothetical protein